MRKYVKQFYIYFTYVFKNKFHISIFLLFSIDSLPNLYNLYYSYSRRLIINPWYIYRSLVTYNRIRYTIIVTTSMHEDRSITVRWKIRPDTTIAPAKVKIKAQYNKQIMILCSNIQNFHSCARIIIVKKAIIYSLDSFVMIGPRFFFMLALNTMKYEDH